MSMSDFPSGERTSVRPTVPSLPLCCFVECRLEIRDCMDPTSEQAFLSKGRSVARHVAMMPLPGSMVDHMLMLTELPGLFRQCWLVMDVMVRKPTEKIQARGQPIYILETNT
jgi:hypothetical protein